MKKILILIILVLIAFLITLIYQTIIFSDHKLHITFCNVGQGDAIFIRTPKGLDILIDGGPDNSVLSCLSNHMPFWDRTIEFVILTHPHADHLNGLISVAKNYKVALFATENIKNNTQGFNLLMDLLGKKDNIKIQYVSASDKLKIKDGITLNIVGPREEFLKLTSPNGTIGESSEFGSIETLLTYKDFSVLLTGDSQSLELQEALKFLFDKSSLTILQVPHHGSKTGLTEEILNALNPKIAVISVGKDNKYGHPAQFTQDLLKSQNIKILRTDQNGEVEAISDGKTWNLN